MLCLRVSLRQAKWTRHPCIPDNPPEVTSSGRQLVATFLLTHADIFNRHIITSHFSRS